MVEKMWPKLVEELRKTVGSQWVVDRKEAMLNYLVDETPKPVRPKPSEKVVLVKPGTKEEVSKILRVANKHKTPVFPRGGGTGLVGGAIPTKSGILLSLERMNKIIEVDKENMAIVAEAGVTLKDLIRTTEKKGLFFPLLPGDESAQLGGLVACNAGGARAIRFGVIRNHVRGVELVLPTGETLLLGGKHLKDVTGYSLLHLVVGSQGTLGVITKVVLGLQPKPGKTLTLVLPYENRGDAIRSVPKILWGSMPPITIEFVERELMERSAKQLGKDWPVKSGRFLLIVVLGGGEEVYSEAERVDRVARSHNVVETYVLESSARQQDVLAVRGNIYHVLKPYTLDVLDISVAPASVARLLDALDGIAERYGMYMPVYGHVGDGNLHPHILAESAGGVRENCLDTVREEIYGVVTSLGGTITAEHGLGKVRVRNIGKYLDSRVLGLMGAIKKVFDPNNILNPGTIIPE
ncbi:MAG: hypothetical protein DRO11_07920 [Methanobacteriota archaeon]|nr:MAG: hypothetical protein DRO11_07920 [Euryarchaeota archaeon]